MEAIVTSIISGIFSLLAIWYQNKLLQKSAERNQQETEKSISKDHETRSPKSLIFNILILFIALLPYAILIVFWKILPFRVEYEAQFFPVYYLIWVFLMTGAVLLSWKRSTLFAKIILVASLAVIVVVAILYLPRLIHSI